MHMTARTSEYPKIKGHRLPVSTLTAGLTRIGRVDFDKDSTSFFRFVGHLRKETRPRGIMNTFGKAMLMNHAVHLQVFDGNEAIGIDDLSTLLMREILPLESDPLMHTGDGLAVFAPLWSAFRKLGVLALHFPQSFFFLPEETRVFYISGIRKGSKRFQAHIDPHLRGMSRKPLRFILDREASVPLGGRGTADGEDFNRAREGAMQNNLEMSDTRDVEFALLVKLETGLWEGEAIIPAFPTETGIAGLLSCFHPSKKGFECQIKVNSNILQHLRMDGTEGRAFGFEDRESGVLLIETQVCAGLLVGFLAFLQQMIVEPAAFVQGLLQPSVLFLGRVYPVLQHLTHTSILAQSISVVKRKERAFHPSSSSPVFYTHFSGDAC